MYTNEEEINHNLIKRIQHPDDLVIAFYDDETIIGVFSIFIEKKYMEVLFCFSTLKKAYDEAVKDLNNIRTRISNEFEPTQELDKYLLLEGMLDERINKAIETMNEEVGEEE